MQSYDCFIMGMHDGYIVLMFNCWQNFPLSSAGITAATGIQEVTYVL